MAPDFSRPVALFGGSFDPVHEGHLRAARAVAKALPGVQVTFVPAAQSPGKAPPLASGELRAEWLRSVADREGFSVWETELKRGGVSYTVDTLKAAYSLGARPGSLYFIMGADAYAQLPSWKEPEAIRALARLVVVNRPGHELELRNVDVAVAVEPHHASSTAIRAALGAEPTDYTGVPKPVRASLENLILLSQNPYARKKE